MNRKIFGAVLLVFPVLFLIAGVFLARRMWAREPHANKLLPRYGAVEAFRLVERSGSPITREDLRGKIWVASFIYTHCTGSCPVLSSGMARLQKAFGRDGRVRLVSFTVDPARDTPERLSRYAKHWGAQDRWFLVTGKKEALSRLMEKSFHLAAARGKDEIVHSSKLVLVDARGFIRGYYDGEDRESLRKLLLDVERLKKEEEVAGT